MSDLKLTIFDDDLEENNPPDPGSLVEGLRSYGYTLQTAVSDLIDNSISAQAKYIWIDCDWNQKSPSIRITDDGKGMDKSALITQVFVYGIINLILLQFLTWKT